MPSRPNGWALDKSGCGTANVQIVENRRSPVTVTRVACFYFYSSCCNFQSCTKPMLAMQIAACSFILSITLCEMHSSGQAELACLAVSRCVRPDVLYRDGGERLVRQRNKYLFFPNHFTNV
jgi:hypothetical protein